MWSIGNINYGLTMRYLGMSMGIGIAIGITHRRTLMTPILNGHFDVLIHTKGGQMTLLGVLVAVIGVGIVTAPASLKSANGHQSGRVQPEKGLMLAVMCGIFSAGMSFAMNAAKPMMKPPRRWASTAVYRAAGLRGDHGAAARWLTSAFVLSPCQSEGFVAKSRLSLAKPFIIGNILLSALGGLMWYLQFFFYAWATPVSRRSMTT